MPQTSKKSYRHESSATPTFSGLNTMNGAQTEEERIAAVLQMGNEDWAQQQQQMAQFVFKYSTIYALLLTIILTVSAAPVYRTVSAKNKGQNIPDHPPPPGYVCYRCGEKGHWIKECPTNDDPTFDGRPRIKRTTGIPKSFLKTVEKPIATVNDGTFEDSKQPSGVMVNSEGEWVVAEPDQATWDRYQAQAKTSVAAQNVATRNTKELQDKGLECQIDKRLFVEPTRTPCCGATFCHECIQNALLDNDLRCPQCSTDNVPIDDLKPDTEMIAKVQQYEQDVSVSCSKDERHESEGSGVIQPTNSAVTSIPQNSMRLGVDSHL